MSYRKPRWRPREQSPAAVERFVNETFPRIRRLADKLHADIAFEDEAGIGLQTQAGKTWGERGTPAEVPASGKRGGVNLLSAVTAGGGQDQHGALHRLSQAADQGPHDPADRDR
ncbi:MAG: hypothetical protein P8Y27_17420 [Chromatiaceae bacterium]